MSYKIKCENVGSKIKKFSVSVTESRGFLYDETKMGKHIQMHSPTLECFVVLVIWNLPQSALADVNPQEINAIIRTRDIALQALNTRDFTKIQPYLHPNFTITTVDNQIFNKVPEFEKYWNEEVPVPLKISKCS